MLSSVLENLLLENQPNSQSIIHAKSIFEKKNMRKDADPLREIPPYIKNISGAPSSYPTHSQYIPINLLLLIISWLDDVRDLARVTRSSRLLYYVTLPRLYERVTLRAYSQINYVDGRPQGYGGGSPFAMGLDSLISSPSNVSHYVKSLRLCGSWKENDVEDFEKGIVPDNTMILNVALKAAIARLEQIEEFIWELNTKPMKTIYQGLASRPNLTSLTLAFPTDRRPKPAFLIPAMPRLKHLHLVNLDPLRYNDDISLLLYEAQELETLKMHWNPRMRNEREPSVNLYAYLGRLAASPRLLNLKTLAMANLFSKNQAELRQSICFDNIQTLITINCGSNDDPTTIFTDSTWDVKAAPIDEVRSKLGKVKVMKLDNTAGGLSQLIFMLTNLEGIYLITPPKVSTEDYIAGSPNTTSTPNGTKPPTPNDSTNGVAATQTSNTPNSDSALSPIWKTPAQKAKHVLLASDYIAAIKSNHAQTLTKLVLPDYWSLGKDVAVNLISACPNLEQIALSLSNGSLEEIRACCQAGPKLKVIRLYHHIGLDFDHVNDEDLEMHRRVMGFEFKKSAYTNLKWLCFSRKVVELGEMIQGDDESVPRRSLRYLKWDSPRVKDVDIFAMDNTSI